MSFDSKIKNINAKKTILNNLNNIINTNKEYYESLKFKLVTDLCCKKKSTETTHTKLSENGTNSYIVKLNETDYDLKLPCWIIQKAFDQVKTDNSRKFRNSRENYILIRKIIKECKIHFIGCVDTTQKSCKNVMDPSFFISNLISEVIAEITNESETSQTKHNSISVKQCDTFAESLINELFTELKLDMSINNEQVNSFNKPNIFIERASSFTDSGNEEHDTLDDMSSINSSIDSNCRQFFVQNFFLKRRHSYDMTNLAKHSEFFDSVLKEEANNFKNSKYKEGYSYMGHAKSHTDYCNLTKRRHSINSFSFNSYENRLINEELIELENLRSFSDKDLIIKIQPGYSSIQKESYSKKKLSKLFLITDRIKFKHKKRIIATNRFKKRLLKIFIKKTLSAQILLSTIGDQFREKNPTNSYNKSILFAENLFESIWKESTKVVKQIYNNIEAHFVDTLVENLFNDAYKDIKTITQTIKRNDRFYFRCKCIPNNNTNSESSNINCLLTVYCMMIALAECNITNQITFVCCHFT